jgi:hypothetical protein
LGLLRGVGGVSHASPPLPPVGERGGGEERRREGEGGAAAVSRHQRWRDPGIRRRRRFLSLWRRVPWRRDEKSEDVGDGGGVKDWRATTAV